MEEAAWKKKQAAADEDSQSTVLQLWKHQLEAYPTVFKALEQGTEEGTPPKAASKSAAPESPAPVPKTSTPGADGTSLPSGEKQKPPRVDPKPNSKPQPEPNPASAPKPKAKPEQEMELEPEPRQV